MSWIQLYTDVPKRYAKSLSNALEAIGSIAVTLTDAADTPIFEPPIGSTPVWASTRVMGLFSAEQDTDWLLQQLGARWPQATQYTIKMDVLEDKDWVREWMAQFHPVQFGKRLWVVPSWLTPPKPEAVNLLLDPGLAFGTGDHPTTALCLNWLAQQPLHGQTVIDFGCGSGILACAAAKLGAATVIGTDIDPQALHASAQNAQQNHVEIALYLPEQLPNQPADIVIANILFNPLKSLATQLVNLLTPQGILAMSGILTTQMQSLIDHYHTLGMKLVSTNTQEDWALVILCKDKDVA